MYIFSSFLFKTPLITAVNGNLKPKRYSPPSGSFSNRVDVFHGPESINPLVMAYQPRSPKQSSNRENDSNRPLYDPYRDLQVPSQILYKLPTSPEYLFQEESHAQRRSWGENLQYYTGIGYLAGASAGAVKGFTSGVKSIEPTDTLKLKINRILNGSGHAGRQIGNRCGVIGLIYAGLESGMVLARDTDDVLNSVVAGLGTGALYKAAAGPRSAAVAGAIGGIAVGLAVTGKQVLKRYVPI